MPRGVTTLSQMVRDLRLETGRSPNLNFGQDEYPALTHLLRRTQETLYWDYEWQFLKYRQDITLSAGQRYYDFPSFILFERIQRIRVKNGNIWQPVKRGISMDNYNTLDSDNDARADPVLAWDILDAGSGDQMEFWPLPATNGGQIRVEGIKGLGAFISDGDVCTLDDTLIVLFAAAKLLARDKADDAKEALSAAQKHLNNLRRGGNRSEEPTPLIGENPATPSRKGTLVIAPGSPE